MTPGECSATGQMLIIEHPIGGRRHADHVFDIEDGIAFADSGWDDPMNAGHPFHIIQGELSGQGPWTLESKVGQCQVYALQADDPDQQTWQQSDQPGKRELCENIIKDQFQL